MTQFIIGFLLGGLIGIVLMACCAASGQYEECERCREKGRE